MRQVLVALLVAVPLSLCAHPCLEREAEVGWVNGDCLEWGHDGDPRECQHWQGCGEPSNQPVEPSPNGQILPPSLFGGKHRWPNETIARTRFGFRMVLDDPSIDTVISRYILGYGTWDPPLSFVFRSLLHSKCRAGASVIDAGANLGTTALDHEDHALLSARSMRS